MYNCVQYYHMQGRIAWPPNLGRLEFKMLVYSPTSGCRKMDTSHSRSLSNPKSDLSAQTGVDQHTSKLKSLI